MVKSDEKGGGMMEGGWSSGRGSGESEGGGRSGGEREWNGGGREWSRVMEGGRVREGVVLCDGDGRPWWMLLAGHCHPWVGGGRL